MNDEAIGEEEPDEDGADPDARERGSKRGAAGAQGRDQDDVEQDVQGGHQNAEPHRRPRVAGRPQRSAEHEEHEHADTRDEQDPDVRERLGLDFGCRIEQREQRGGRDVPDRRQHAEREQESDEQRLIHRPVDLVGLSGAGEPRDEDPHPGKDRGHEYDDEDEDLQADADGGIADVAHVVAHHRLVDDALQSADDVLHHGGPREAPDGPTERALDNGPVERPGVRARLTHAEDDPDTNNIAVSTIISSVLLP
jgi:hypothetical protein